METFQELLKQPLCCYEVQINPHSSLPGYWRCSTRLRTPSHFLIDSLLLQLMELKCGSSIYSIYVYLGGSARADDVQAVSNSNKRTEIVHIARSIHCESVKCLTSRCCHMHPDSTQVYMSWLSVVSELICKTYI